MKRALPEIDLEKCTGCRECIDLCPTHAVSLSEDKAVIASPEDCNYCAECESICPSGAIKCPFDIILTVAEPPRNREKPDRRAARKTIKPIIVSDFNSD